MFVKRMMLGALAALALAAAPVLAADAPPAAIDDGGIEDASRDSGYIRERPPDLNADRRVDVLDMVELIMSWGECKGCPADLNEDGYVDGSDLVVLLFNWSA